MIESEGTEVDCAMETALDLVDMEYEKYTLGRRMARENILRTTTTSK